MAIQWLSCCTAVLLLLVHMDLVHMQMSCTGGIPGIPGIHGQNGRDGAKGEKGDPGEAAQPIRGQKGVQGPRGPPGRPGMKGDIGLPGDTGDTGQKGEKGRPFNPANRQKSFFSYKLEISQTPDTTIDFNRVILPDLDSQFQGETLTNGTFLSKIKGIYFFSFHISARIHVCLKLMKGSNSQMTLCGTSKGFLVTSGSALLELQVGDMVSLQTTTDKSIVTGQSSTSHTFTGFLIFPTT